MKKYHVAVLLVVSFVVGMMAGGIGLADNEQVNVWINGKRLSSSPGPQLIDGRVFVPLRAVSESMGATVGWDSLTGTAYIASQRDALTDIEIVGDASFQKEMRDALQLLKDKDPENYRFVGQYVRKIVLDNTVNMPGTYGNDMIVYMPGDYQNADKYWWVSALVHEAMHIKYDYNAIETTTEAEEIEGAYKSIEVIKKTGGPQWMIDYVEKGINDKWWEKSPFK